MEQVPDWLGVGISLGLLLAAVLTPILSSLSGKVHKNQVDNANLRAHVAENYATKPELKESVDRIEKRIDDGFTRLDKKLENIK
ncbi:hypothetical protein [Oceanimonas baumannii]|uniref:hypothetical protein n=1 Tax=Oceanimonas baumannii TaxID=129578 RepID=UPI0010657353|nr:hypothetical protein [Oceanimonas baumannii]